MVCLSTPPGLPSCHSGIPSHHWQNSNYSPPNITFHCSNYKLCVVDIPTLKIRQPHILCVLQRRAWLSPPGSLSCSPHPNLSKRKKRTSFTGYTPPPPPSLLTLLHFFLSPPPPVSFSLRSSTFLTSLFHSPTLNSLLLRPPPLGVYATTN